MGMGGGGQSIASLFVRLGADTRQFKTGMRGAEAELKGSTARMNSNARSFSNMQTMYYAAAGVALFMFVKKSADASIELNRSMANVGTLIPGNIKRLKELRGEVQRLAIETGKSSKDLSEGLYHVISAFQDSAETVEILTITAKAATAGLSTTKESLDLLSAVTKGYGDTTAEAVQHAADLAFYAVKMGQTTFPELAGSMRMVIPLAAALNVSQKELFASYSALTGVTGNTAQVTTQLAAIMRGFMKPTVDMAKSIDNLGYSSAEMMVYELGLVGALQKVIGATDGSTREITKLYERARALPAVFNLAGAGAETFERKLRGIADASGMATTALKEQTEGINKLGFSMMRFAQLKKTMWEKIGGGITQFFSLGPFGWALRLDEYISKQREEAERVKKSLETNQAKWEKYIGGAEAGAGLTPEQFLPWLKTTGDPQNLAYAKVLEAEKKAIQEFNAFLKNAAIDAGEYWKELLQGPPDMQMEQHIRALRNMSGTLHGTEQEMIEQLKAMRAATGPLEIGSIGEQFHRDIMAIDPGSLARLEKVPELILISADAMRKFHEEAAMVADLIAYDLVGAFVAAAQAGENWLSTMLHYLIRIAQQMASMWLWEKIYDWRMSKAPGGSSSSLPGGSSPIGPFDSSVPIVNIIDNRTTLDPAATVSTSGDTIDIILESAIKGQLNSGVLDDTMRNVYGVSRNVVVR